MITEDILKQLSVLKGLTDRGYKAILDIGEIQQYDKGDQIFNQGEDSHALYIVLEGKVDILVDPAWPENLETGTIGLQKVSEQVEGTSLGEISLIDRSPRPNSAVCSSDHAKLWQISQNALAKLNQNDPESGYAITQNIANALSDQLRETTALITEKSLHNHYLNFLCEELDTDYYKCDGIVPLEKKLIIRDPSHFILSGFDRISDVLPNVEEIDLLFFVEPDVLRSIMQPGTPSGAMILNTLFSQIGNVRFDQETSTELFEPICDPNSLGRSGSLVVHKQLNSQHQDFFLQWEVKGISYDKISSTTTANVFIHIAYDRHSVDKPVEDLISTINMPIQQYVFDSLPEKSSLQSRNPYHLVVIHHRTHEVVMTLRALSKLGFNIDTFIGIPYGESNWPSMRMLDHVSGHNYQCLRMIEHPIEPTTYQFDFRQSSFLQGTDEQVFVNLYDEESAASHSYMAAMTKLVETRLVRSIQNCIQEKTKLLIYEDGGYVVPLIYQIYQDSNHDLHSLIKRAVDENIIEGAVEVTVAGERRDLAAIESHGGKALLPVLSTARDDLKAVFESKGVSQAVIDSTSTALGRLGLPTFETRKVAVIGGNGAIGTRLVEELTEMQNTPSSVFAVDIVDRAFSREIDDEKFPHAAIKVDYLNLGRYLVEDTCLPVIVDLSFGDQNPNLYSDTIKKSVQEFFLDYHDSQGFEELVITNAFPSPSSPLKTLWEQIDTLNQLWESVYQQYGYVPDELKLLPNGKGMSKLFSKEGYSKKVTFLAPEQVLLFKKVTRLIQSKVDTIIGISGLPVLDEQDVNAFLMRENSQSSVDELVLVSGSSKDYEFKKAIVFLDEILEVISEKPIEVDEQLARYAKFYEQKMCFVIDSDWEIVEQVISAPLIANSIVDRLVKYPEFIKNNGFNEVQPDTWVSSLAEWIRTKIKRNLAIRKSLHQDVGTIYQIQVNGKYKKLVLLANGFVINFFAKHEKGVKTEYIDPIVTMQMLGVIKLATTEEAIDPGVYRMAQHLKADDMDLFWKALEDKSRPVSFDTSKSRSLSS